MSTLQVLTDDDAWKIGCVIRDELRARNLSASIAVVDRGGFPMFQVSMVGARPFTATVALRKAEQAAQVGRRTRWIRDQVKEGSIGLDVFGIPQSRFVGWAGGVPIYTPEGVLLGGAGVSNLAEHEDEQICIIGVRTAGFWSDREDTALVQSPEDVLGVHHVAFGLPTPAQVEQFVGFLILRGATIVTEDTTASKYFLRLNPGDTTLLEIFYSDGLNMHVDFAVRDLQKAITAHPDGMTYQGSVDMLFLSPLFEEGDHTVEIGFSQRG